MLRFAYRAAPASPALSMTALTTDHESRRLLTPGDPSGVEVARPSDPGSAAGRDRLPERRARGHWLVDLFASAVPQ
jgi:hypothetical protein